MNCPQNQLSTFPLFIQYPASTRCLLWAALCAKVYETSGKCLLAIAGSPSWLREDDVSPPRSCIILSESHEHPSVLHPEIPLMVLLRPWEDSWDHLNQPEEHGGLARWTERWPGGECVAYRGTIVAEVGHFCFLHDKESNERKKGQESRRKVPALQGTGTSVDYLNPKVICHDFWHDNPDYQDFCINSKYF